jgi:hypothetical protein
MNAKFLITPSSTPSKYLRTLLTACRTAFFHASLFFAFSAFSQRWLRVIASDDDGGQRYIQTVAMSLLSIQSSSAVVIASDDDGGGQRYIRSSSNVGPVDPVVVLPPSLPATTTAAVKGIFGAVAMSGSCRSRVVVLPPSLPATTTAAVKGIFRAVAMSGSCRSRVVVLPPSLVPPDSAKVTRLATGSEKPPVAAFE